MKRDKRKRFNDRKLSTKIGIIASAMLILIFSVFILITVGRTQKAVSAAISGEFDSMASGNALMVKQTIDAATTVANNISGYLKEAYRLSDQGCVSMTGEKAPLASNLGEVQPQIFYSSIYDTPISRMSLDVELYIKENAIRTAADNDDIAGVACMFEPYAFDSNIESYGFYVSEEDGKNNAKILPYGNYSDYSKEDSYRIAAQTKKISFTDPYNDVDGTNMVTVSIPILIQDKLKGVIQVVVRLSRFDKLTSTSAEYPSMYTMVFKQNGMILYDSEGDESIGKNLGDFIDDEAALNFMLDKMGQGEPFTKEINLQDGRSVTQLLSPVQAGDEIWWAMTALNISEINKASTNLTILLIVLSTAALLVMITVLVSILTRMLNPIQKVVKAANEISKGHLDMHLEAASNDEIGQLTTAFDSTVSGLAAIIKDMSCLLQEISKGNFAIKTEAEQYYIGDYENLLLSMHALNTRLSDTLSQINEASGEVNAGAEHVSFGSQELSQGAAEQASSVEELAATINEISEQVRETAQNALEARSLSAQAGDEVTICNQQMQEMIVAMEEISHKSGEIEKIIKAIEDIAFQTNILALNAAVEAARAGAAGKGFAVVADEVRNLASKSAEASQNTSTLIAGSIEAVEKGTKIASKTAESLLSVVQGTQSVSVIVDKIAQAATTQAASVNQVTQGIDQISSVVQTNSATAEESAAASEELSGQAQMLKNLVGQFKLN